MVAVIAIRFISYVGNLDFVSTAQSELRVRGKGKWAKMGKPYLESEITGRREKKKCKDNERASRN